MQYFNLFCILKKNGITPTSLIRDSVISSSAMGRLRQNGSVNLYTLDKLSTYLKCDLLDLIREPASETEPSCDHGYEDDDAESCIVSEDDPFGNRKKERPDCRVSLQK